MSWYLNMISGNDPDKQKKKRWHFFSWKSLEKSFQLSEIMVYFHVAICNLLFTLSYWNFSHMQFALSLNVWLFSAENFKSFCVSAHFLILEQNIAWVSNCKCTWAAKLQRFNKCWFWNPRCNPGSCSQFQFSHL